jgi:sec-independent protein translocase protein TatA
MGIGNPIHLMFLGAVALVVLGPKRLPELARALGKGMQEFRDSMSEAANGEGQEASPVTPQQPQLVASSQSHAAAEAPVVDPNQTIERPSSPPLP